MLATPAYAAEPHPLDDIRAAAIAAVGATGDTAQAGLDAALRLARCSQPLQASASGPKTALVRCPDTPGWRLYVPVRVQRTADVVVLAGAVPAGVPIGPAQLRVQRRETDGSSAVQAYADPTALVGQVPNRPLAAGAVPTPADFSPAMSLRRGDPVTLVARTGGVEVRMQGRALGPVQAGGRVAVENTDSHRVLRGRVVGEGVVDVSP